MWTLIHSTNLIIKLTMKKMNSKSVSVVNERFPYRFIEKGLLENGKPDCRIQKFDYLTKRYKDMYLCDNQMQLMTAMEDFNYCKWLDPEGVPCYTNANGTVKNPYV